MRSSHGCGALAASKPSPARAWLAASRILSTRTLLNALGAGQPSAAIDSAGNAIVAYQVTTVPPSIGALRHAAGALVGGRGDSITPSGGHAFSDPNVAANPSGQMVVTFSDTLGTSAAAAVRGTVSAGWGVSPTVGALSASPVSHGPLATISDTGNAVVGWSTSSAVQFSQLRANRRVPGARQPFSRSPPTRPDNFALAGNGRGDAIAGWGTFDTSVMQNVVQAVVKPNTSATFGAPQIISNRHRLLKQRR